MTDLRTPTAGELLVALSNRIVAVYKDLYGKGPVKVRTWLLDDIVLCVIRGSLTQSEQTLIRIGRGDRVALQRDSFHEVTAPVFAQVVEEVTGRVVQTVLDAGEEKDDVGALVFVLEPPEAAALRDTDEGLQRERKQMRKKGREVREQSRLLREKHNALRPVSSPPLRRSPEV